METSNDDINQTEMLQQHLKTLELKLETLNYPELEVDIKNIDKRIDILTEKIRKSVQTNYEDERRKYKEKKTSKLGGKKINADANEILNELKEDKHSGEKNKFMKEAKVFAKKQRAGRGIRLEVTDDIKHTGLSENEYRALERYYEEDEEDNGALENYKKSNSSAPV